MKRPILFYIRKFFNHPESGALVTALVIFVLFSIVGKNFLTSISLLNMMTLIYENGLVALGITLLMISGEFNLSVGSVWGLSSMLVILMVNSGVPTWISVVMVILIGIAIGFLQGLVVVKIGIPSFIVTLAFLMGLRGIIFTGTGGSIVSLRADTPFLRIFSYKFTNGISVSSLWFIGIAIVLILVLNRTRFGNWIFATGGNKLAAIQSGVPVDRVKLILFSLSAGLASLGGGAIQLSRFRSVEPLRGDNLEFIVIAMAVIGGNRLSGGYGSIVGTVLGAIIIAVIQNGMVLAQVSNYWFYALVGIVILLSVIINNSTQKLIMGVRNE